MRWLWCARRKVATRSASDGARGRGEGREKGRTWKRVRRGRGGVFPHYKFNLTNGSENLETMEYMKCGHVYHASRRGVVPTAILSGPIHILGEREDERTGGRRGGESGSRPKCRGPPERRTAKHASNATRSRRRAGSRRTVPVAFGLRRAEPVTRYKSYAHSFLPMHMKRRRAFSQRSRDLVAKIASEWQTNRIRFRTRRYARVTNVIYDIVCVLI